MKAINTWSYVKSFPSNSPSNDNIQKRVEDALKAAANDEEQPFIDILWAKVKEGTIEISETTFSVTMKISWKTYYVIWNYSIFHDNMNSVNWVNPQSVDITHCTPAFKGKADRLKECVHSFLTSPRCNPYLESKTDIV